MDKFEKAYRGILRKIRPLIKESSDDSGSPGMSLSKYTSEAELIEHLNILLKYGGNPRGVLCYMKDGTCDYVSHPKYSKKDDGNIYIYDDTHEVNVNSIKSILHMTDNDDRKCKTIYSADDIKDNLFKPVKIEMKKHWEHDGSEYELNELYIPIEVNDSDGTFSAYKVEFNGIGELRQIPLDDVIETELDRIDDIAYKNAKLVKLGKMTPEEADIAKYWRDQTFPSEEFKAAKKTHNEMIEKYPERHKYTWQRGGFSKTYICSCGFEYNVNTKWD